MPPEAQANFSALYPAAAADRAGRERKARTVLAVLGDFFGTEQVARLRVLDVGASTGAVDAWLAPHVAELVGLDIDAPAIAVAQRDFRRANLSFGVASGLALPFAAGTFDVVLNMHVYEHVADDAALMREVRRVLRPGGVCYFAAGNRFQPVEPHYQLPLLSAIPKPLAHAYLRVLGRGTHYYENHRSYWGLRRLVRGFAVRDYTRRLIAEPARFHVEYLFAGSRWRLRAARAVARFAYPLLPGYVWLLEKAA